MIEAAQGFLRLFVMGNRALHQRFGVDKCPHLVLLDPEGNRLRALDKRELSDLRTEELRAALAAVTRPAPATDATGAPSVPDAPALETAGYLVVSAEGSLLHGAGAPVRLVEGPVLEWTGARLHRGPIVVLRGARLVLRDASLAWGGLPGAPETTVTLIDKVEEDDEEEAEPEGEPPALILERSSIAAAEGESVWPTVNLFGRGRIEAREAQVNGGFYVYGGQLDVERSDVADIGIGGNAAARLSATKMWSFDLAAEGLNVAFSGLRGAAPVSAAHSGAYSFELKECTVQRYLISCDGASRVTVDSTGVPAAEAPAIALYLTLAAAVAGTDAAPLALPSGPQERVEWTLGGCSFRGLNVSMAPAQVKAGEGVEARLGGAFEAMNVTHGAAVHLRGATVTADNFRVEDGGVFTLRGEGSALGERGSGAATVRWGGRLETEGAAIRAPLVAEEGATVTLRHCWFTVEEKDLAAMLTLTVTGRSTVSIEPPSAKAAAPDAPHVARFPSVVELDASSRVVVRHEGSWVPLRPGNPFGIEVRSIGPAEAAGDAAAAPLGSVRAVHDFDAAIEAGLHAAGIPPAPLADDADFLRRVCLDVAGSIPSPEEVEAFLQDRNPRKRAKKIDDLLASPAYAEHWSRIWMATLIGNPVGGSGLHPWFQEWLHDAFARNLPWDQLVREIVLAEGWLDQTKVGVYLYRWEDPADQTSAVARHFMGVQIRCAQCHDHPFDTRWKQKDFWAVAAFFSRLQAEYSESETMKDPTYGCELPRQRYVEAEAGEVDLPEAKHPMVVPPRFLGRTNEVSPPHRRRAFAQWLTAADNPWFARALVNRLWGHLLARGLVHPVDDFGERAVPAWPEVLNGLAEEFAQGGFDVKALLRRILNTRVYQRSSVYPKEKRPPPERFAVQSLRRLSRHQLLQSIGRATDFDFVFRFLPEEGADAGAEDPSEMAGKPEEQEYDAREDFLVQVQRSDSPVERALLRLNGSVFNDSIGGGKRLTAVLERRFTEADRIRWLFLSTLSRPPTRSETDRFAEYVRAAPEPYAAYADVLWTLLNSSEFGVNR